MAPRSLNALIATALAVAGVCAGPCKPSLASSSIISFSSAYSSAETESTTGALSMSEVLSSTETQTTAAGLSSTETFSTADADATEALSTTTSLSTTEEQSTTVFESTTSTETTTTAATTTTEAECTVACTHVIGKSGACTIPFQVKSWEIDESWHIGSPTVTDMAACANACASDCRCKSFASYGTSCDLYSGTQVQVNPIPFYLGSYFFDLAACYECDD